MTRARGTTWALMVAGMLAVGPASVVSVERATAEPEQEPPQLFFLLDEAYTQQRHELQVTPAVVYLRRHGTESEIDEDGEEEVKQVKAATLRAPLELEWGITDRLELDVEASWVYERRETTPFRTAKRDAQHLQAFEDLATGLRWLLVPESARWPAVSIEYTLEWPTGDPAHELGSQHLGHAVGLAVSRDFGRWVGVLNLEGGVHHRESRLNENGTRSREFTLRDGSYGVGAVYRITDRWNGFLELSHEREDEIAANERRSERSLTILPGLSYAWETRWWGREHQWELGAGVPVGVSRQADDWGVLVKLRYESQF